jgi:UDP-N-acetylmuramate dehydrogenase
MKDAKLKLLTDTLSPERVKEQEKLSHHTFSKLGGPAQYFYIATTQKELINALNTAYELKIPFYLLGAGTKFLIPQKGFLGLTIKNRTSHIKVGGVKGKVGKNGIGVEEALVEVDSGVTLGKINEFLKSQNLKEIIGISSLHATVGGALFLDPVLIKLTQKITIWEQGDVFDISPEELKRNKHIIISAIIRIKASL